MVDTGDNEFCFGPFADAKKKNKMLQKAKLLQNILHNLTILHNENGHCLFHNYLENIFLAKLSENVMPY